VRYLITGGSGFIGSKFIEELSGRDETDLIVNFDVKPPATQAPNTEFVRGDVRDFASMRELMERKQITSLVHLAFLLNPIHDEYLMYDIDINGTERVLRAAAETGVQHVQVTTSAIAYGAWPDNPRPIAEDHPVRGMPDFSYGRDKADSDRLCQLWALEHPDRVMTIVRPTIVFGPGVDNFIYRPWETAPFMPLPDGVNEQIQFVHVDDTADALIRLLDAKAPGAFNVAADGTMTWQECADMIGLKTRNISYRTAYRLYDWAWKLRLPRVDAPAGVLGTVRYPWIVSNEKLKAETGWAPKYDARETFELTMRAKGKLPAGAAAPQAAPVG